MIKVSIAGAETPLAGEIIRILVNHPETEFISLFSPLLNGRSVASHHHGLIGETPLKFTDKLNLEDSDLLIFSEGINDLYGKLEEKYSQEDLKQILLGGNVENSKNEGIETGVSEVNRKALVRGAKTAYIPSPAVVPSIISLLPLAKFLLLNSDIDIDVELPSDLADNTEIEYLEKYLEKLIKATQSSFNNKISLNIIENKEQDRGAKTRISFQSKLPVEEIENIYEQLYDDHNFTFTSKIKPEPKEVVGTQKVVINISKPDDDSLILDVVSDARMRGGAGDAVHIMNLFFGLHEKTGLEFKASSF